MPKHNVLRSFLSVRAPIWALCISIVFLLVVVLEQTPNRVQAATSGTVNFQARLMTAAGNTVADGDYNVEFKLYDVLSSSGSSQGSCTGDVNCLWTETRVTSNKVRVVNGYLTVNLGSVNAFPTTINWDQELWLSMNVGDTGSANWDGEMTPRLKLTAVPYAFRAGLLVTQSGANKSTLSFAAPTDGRSITIPDESGTICMRESTACNFAPSTGSTSYIHNQSAGNQTADFRISGTGRANTALQSPAFRPVTDGTTAISIQNAGGSATALTVDTTNSRVGIGGSFAPQQALDVIGSVQVRDAASATKSYRLRTSGADLDLESAGKKLYISNWENADYTGEQRTYIVLENEVNMVQAIGGWHFRTAADGTTRHIIDGSTGTNVEFNKTGESTDFSVQGENDANLLFVDGSADRVGIGTNAPAYKLEVTGTAGISGNVTVGGTYNTNTFTSSSLQFGAAGTAIVQSAASQALTITGHAASTWSTDSGALTVQGASGLNLKAASGNIVLGTSDTTATLLVLDTKTDAGDPGATVEGAMYYNDNSNKFRCYQNTGWTDCIATGTGVATVGTIDSQAKSANGAVISGTSIVLQTADASNPGLVSTGTQTFAGAKTLTGAVTLQNATDSTSAFAVKRSTGAGGATVLGVDTSNSRVGIGTATPGRTLDISINDSIVNAAPLRILQQGSGDASFEFNTVSTGNSFFLGQDASNAGAFVINSSTAAIGAPEEVGYTRVQAVGVNEGAGASTATFSSAPTEGNLLVVMSAIRDDGTLPSINGENVSIGQTTTDGWTLLAHRCQGVSGGGCGTANSSLRRAIAIWWKVAGASEPSAIETSWNNGGANGMLAQEFSADVVDAEWAFEALATNDTGTNSNPTSMSTGTTASVTGEDLLVIGGIAWRNESGDPASIAYTNGLGTVVNDLNSNSSVSFSSAFSHDVSGGTKSSTVSWTGSNHEAIGGVFVFSAGLDVSSGDPDTFANAIFTLTQDGALKLRNISDSTSAFHVQNASGTSILNVNTTNRRVGINNAAPSYALDVSDSQASSYVMRIENTSAANTADGLLISLGVANGSRTTGNRFIDFAGGSTVAGKIQGGASVVSYQTSGADYAEYFRADPNDMPRPGELVRLNQGQNQSVLKSNDNPQAPLVGIVSTSPGFIGNGPVCHIDDENCDTNYARFNTLVALSGQVPTRVNTSSGSIAIGDPITASRTTGEGAKATHSTYIVGYAMEPLSGGSGTINVLVRPQYLTVNQQDILQATSLNLLGNAGIQGNMAISGGLNVAGITTLTDLTVTGSAIAKNLLVIEDTIVKNLKIAGLIEAGGDTKLTAAVNTRQVVLKEFTASGPIRAGSVVVLDVVHAGQVTTTVQSNDTRVIGVAVTEATQPGDKVEVAIGGWVQVLVGHGVAVSPGELIVSDSQPGLARPESYPPPGAILGKATSKEDSDNLVWLLITLQ